MKQCENEIQPAQNTKCTKEISFLAAELKATAN